MNQTQEMLREISLLKASDIFIVAGRAVSYRLNDQIYEYSEQRMMPEDTEKIIRDIYELAAGRNIETLLQKGDDDFSFAIPGISRFRVNTYMQRGSLAAVIRIISFTLPSPDDLGIPSGIVGLGDLNKGLVLVTGTAGSGKSTTLASLTISTKPVRNTSSLWKILWNTFTDMKKASSASVRSIQTRPAIFLR